MSGRQTSPPSATRSDARQSETVPDSTKTLREPCLFAGLRIEVLQERAMHQIEAEFTFAAAHRLPRYEGKCFNLHGHNYRFQVVLRGEPDPWSGIFVDFSDVDKMVKEQVLDRVDHTNLNDFIENPTAENIATWMWHRLEGKLPGLAEVRLWEIPTSCVVYRGPGGKW
jgi:6-pyruvoyltetrahydropterin/6-carboxytetrahydropterin synthase